MHVHLTGALALVLPVVSAASGIIQGRAVVVDGDTLEIAGIQVRLAGIDAPELDQPCSTKGDVLAESSLTYLCGEQATAALAGRIGNDLVVCEPQAGADRTILAAVCRLNDEDLGAWMVRSGWARAYPVGGSVYAAEEKPAQAARNGIWHGDFLNPWDWRRDRRAGTEGGQRRLRVRVEAANLRTKPSREGRLMTALSQGTVVEQLGQSGEWDLIKPSQVAPGWMFRALLEPLQPSEEADP